MIKKIQKQLLLHYPLLWNIRIVPVLLILIGIHFLFFWTGYFSTHIDFNQTYYYYSSWSDLVLAYFLGDLVAILLLIGWLVFYNRNNGFKYVYPRTNTQLYLEWALILIIVIGLALIPFTLKKGYECKWKSLAGEEETQQALNILYQAELLIPHDQSYRYSNYTDLSEFEKYTYSPAYDSPIPIPYNMPINPDTLDLDLFAFEYNWKGNIEISGYKGMSLLFFKSDQYKYEHFNQDSEYLTQEYRQRIQECELVKEWLIKGETDSILSLMTAFNALQQKYHLTVDLTPEDWLKRIYHPPFFPVNISTVIYPENPDDDDYDSGYNSDIPYLQYRELESAYEQIQSFYDSDYEEENENLVLVLLCVAMMFSLFVFSFRITGGKSWLIALIATGVLLFITILLGVAIGEALSWHNEENIFIAIFLSWITLYGVLLYKIISKIRNGWHKGRSSIYMNLLLWLTPCIIPLLYFTSCCFIELTDRHDLHLNDHVATMFWINLAVICPVMGVMALLIRKWKSIAEE